jgi:arylsulfatase A-like enzyme
MGYRTPNIDRVANEGMIFTDYYGEQSCTAGRSSFITGQSVFRTGGKFLKTFEQFPPRQKPASFSVGGQMEELEKALSRLNGDID